MNSDIYVEWDAANLGMAGTFGGQAGVHSYPGTLMHEAMHAFWQFWDGFPDHV